MYVCAVWHNMLLIYDLYQFSWVNQKRCTKSRTGQHTLSGIFGIAQVHADRMKKPLMKKH